MATTYRGLGKVATTSAEYEVYGKSKQDNDSFDNLDAAFGVQVITSLAFNKLTHVV